MFIVDPLCIHIIDTSRVFSFNLLEQNQNLCSYYVYLIGQLARNVWQPKSRVCILLE